MDRAEHLIIELRQRLKEIDLPDIETKNYDKGETERAMRQAQISELDAVNTYQQMAQSTKDPKIRDLLNDVADEEKVHQGEFEAATNMVDPDNEKETDKGNAEAKEKTLEESLYQFHEELMQEGPIMNAVGAGVKTALRHTPVVGQVMNAYDKSKQAVTSGQQQATQQLTQQPAQPAQAAGQKKPGLITRAANAIGDIAGQAAGAYANAQTQKTNTSNSLHTAGQGGASILQTALQAITQFASSPVPQQESITTYEQLRHELQEAYGDVGTIEKQRTKAQPGNEKAGAKIKAQDTKKLATPAPQEAQPPSPQAKQDTSKKGLMLKAAKQVADSAGKHNGDMTAVAKDPAIAKGITDLITASQQFKIPIPGLEGITADKIQQAVQELSTPEAQTDQQPATGVPVANPTPAETQAADPNQAMGLINQIAPRALGNIVKQILKSGGEESKQVAAMIIKATQTAQ